jgi:methylamine dehydrogenase light chain
MSRFDRWFERSTRKVARSSSRRSFLARFGVLLAGGAVVPLLPVARAAEDGSRVVPPKEGIAGPEGDPTSCEYWRHCAIDGFLCSCCGGSQTACPPGTEMSPITWIGTCHNPADGKDYILSYNDCCGKGFCGRCLCTRNEGDRPIYYPFRSNDINWCMGTTSRIYNCSTAIVLGVAVEAQAEK